MINRRRLISTLAALVMILSIHASSAWAEGGASPTQVVKDFAKAYFMLDDSMAGYLSKEARVNENNVDMAELYFDLKKIEARDRGYNISYFKMRPLLLKTHVINMEDSSAQVQLDAVTLRSINPLFRIVGYIFGLLEEHEYQDVIEVVKENGEWKIGPGALEMPI